MATIRPTIILTEAELEQNFTESTTMVELEGLMRSVEITVRVRRSSGSSSERRQNTRRGRRIPEWVPATQCGAPTLKPGKDPCQYSWKRCPHKAHAVDRIHDGKAVNWRHQHLLNPTQ